MSFTGGVARCQCASAIRAIQVRIDDGTLLGPASPFGIIRVCMLIGIRTLLLFPIPVGGVEPLKAP